MQTGISAIPDLDGGREVGCGGRADGNAAFGVTGLGKRCHLAGTTSGSPSTTFGHSVSIGHHSAPLHPRKHRNNAMPCVFITAVPTTGLGGVGPGRGLRGEGRRGWCEERARRG